MVNKKKSAEYLSIESKIQPILESKNFILIDIELRKEEDLVVTVFVHNTTDTGVDSISKLNEPIYTALEELSFLKNGFMLEVSSPGIFRKIKNTEEFNIFNGRSIKVMDNSGDVFTGVISSFINNKLCIKTEKDDIFLDIESIKKAALNG